MCLDLPRFGKHQELQLQEARGPHPLGTDTLGCVSEHQRPSQNSAPKCKVVLKSKQSKNKLGVEESQVEEPHDLCTEVPIMAEIQL